MGKAEEKKRAKELGEMLDRFYRYWGYMQDRVDNWKEYYKIAQFYRESGSHGYKYNVAKPIAFIFVENFVSSVINPLFESEQIIEVTPSERMNFIRPDIMDSELARQLQKCINHFLIHPDTQYFLSMEAVIKSLAYYGTAVSQLVPRFGSKDTNFQYLGPKLMLNEIYDVVPNPYAYSLEEGKDLFIREIITNEELLMREHTHGYQNTKQAINDEWVDRDIKKEIFEEMGLGGSSEDSGDEEVGGRVLLLHYYDSDGHVKICAGHRAILFDSRTPKKIQLPQGGEIDVVMKPYQYYPFESVNMNAGPHEFYGMGIPQLVKQAQQLTNIRTSQRLENIEVVLQKPLLVNPLHNINIETLHTGPGNIILTDDIDRSIKPLEFNDITRSSYQEDEIDFRLAEEAASTQQVSRGQAPTPRITATTGTQLLQTAQQRSSTLIYKLGIMQSSIARKIAIQIRQYMAREDYERIIGEHDAGLYRLEIKELHEFIDYQPRLKNFSNNKEQRLQSLTQLLNIASTIPVVNMPNLIYDIVQEFFPNTNPARYIAPQILQAVQQQMAAQLLQQGAGGGGVGTPDTSTAPPMPAGQQNPKMYQQGMNEQKLLNGENI